MSFDDVLDAIDGLSPDQLDTLQQKIVRRRNTVSDQLVDPALMHSIRREILRDAQPVELRAGTMDADKLAEAFDTIREGFSQDDLDAIAQAMNEEYIEPDSVEND